MNIKTVENWREFAAATMPKLPDYAAENGCKFDLVLAEKLFKTEQNKELSGMFDQLWADLPDSSSIRYQPFFDLCDLCSENWVLFE